MVLFLPSLLYGDTGVSILSTSDCGKNSCVVLVPSLVEEASLDPPELELLEDEPLELPLPSLPPPKFYLFAA
jgi:hypothetical protein